MIKKEIKAKNKNQYETNHYIIKIEEDNNIGVNTKKEDKNNYTSRSNNKDNIYLLTKKNIECDIIIITHENN